MTGLFSQQKMRMEMIDFQVDDKFGPNLEAIIARIYGHIEKNKYESFEVQKLPEIQEIQDITLKRIGLNTYINTDSSNMAAIIPFHLGESAILMDNQFVRANWYTNEQKVLRNKTAGQTAWVDENKATMGGVYSQYINTLFMNYNLLHAHTLSPAEVTAVQLHEYGHGYYACALSSRLDRANQILTAALASGEKDRSKYSETVFKALKADDINVSKEIVEGLTSENPMVFCQSSLTLVSECIMTQMENGKYDDTSFEQLADNFAARFGYGHSLVTGLEKFYPGGVRNYRCFMTLIITMQTISIISSFLQSIMVVRLIMMTKTVLMHLGPFLTALKHILFGIIYAVIMVRTAGEDGRDFTYDDLHKRYNRIRLQVIELIKTKQLTKIQADEAIKTVTFISKLIEGVKPYRGPLDFLFNTFNPKDKRAKTSIERQQAIEELLSNNLFVASLKAQISAGK